MSLTSIFDRLCITLDRDKHTEDREEKKSNETENRERKRGQVASSNRAQLPDLSANSKG